MTLNLTKLTKTLLRALVFIASSLLLTACGDDNPYADLQSYLAEVRQRPPLPIEPVPNFKTYEAFAYTLNNHRSPFQAPKTQTTNSHLHPDLNRKKEALEFFPLDALRMVGVLAHGNKVWALISAPDNSVYRVSQGSYLGKHFGRITKVSHKKIEILETRPDGNGGWKRQPATLILSEQETK